MPPQPLIAVTDVEVSSRWYQRLPSCQSAHGAPDYERLVSEGALSDHGRSAAEREQQRLRGCWQSRPYTLDSTATDHSH
jgi:hypothetical protein